MIADPQVQRVAAFLLLILRLCFGRASVGISLSTDPLQVTATVNSVSQPRLRLQAVTVTMGATAVLLGRHAHAEVSSSDPVQVSFTMAR